MSYEEVQWDADESASHSMANLFPLSWMGFQDAVAHLRRHTFKHNARRLTNSRPMSLEERMFIHFWSKRLKEYLWGARLAHLVEGERHFSPWEIDTRLVEIGLSGEVVYAAIDKAVELSRSDKRLNAKENNHEQLAINEFLRRNMDPAWEYFENGIRYRELPIEPVRPKLNDVMELIDKFGYRPKISRAGMTYIRMGFDRQPK